MKLEGALNINKKMPMFWFSYPTKKLLKFYPYFAFHYKFAETCIKDEKARLVWENTPKYSADDLLKPIRNGLMDTLCPRSIERMLDDNAPMYKLNWRVELGREKDKYLIDHILTQNTYVNNE
jgi:hypothetical protein